MKETPLSELRYATFAEHCNSTFQASITSKPAVPLELVRAELHRAEAAAESFSLLFAGPRDPLLPQATYSVEHPVLGRFALFIVPVKRDEQFVYYEAVFNRNG